MFGPTFVIVWIFFSKHAECCIFDEYLIKRSKDRDIDPNVGDLVENIMNKFGNDIASIIVEPIAGNMGLVKPEKLFLTKLYQYSICFHA